MYKKYTTPVPYLWEVWYGLANKKLDNFESCLFRFFIMEKQNFEDDCKCKLM